jgi:hypothetical protein
MAVQSLEITGRCLCGAVRFRFRERAFATRACWCRACQYVTGGNASISAFFRTESFDVTGDVSSHVREADSGARIRNRFCTACGTPLFADDLDRPEVIVVRLGALDDREIGNPQSTIWTSSAPSWGYVDPEVEAIAAHAKT